MEKTYKQGFFQRGEDRNLSSGTLVHGNEELYNITKRRQANNPSQT